MTDDIAIEVRALYVRYLLMKAAAGDWHGVCDAGNDLREHEAAHPTVKWPTLNISWRTI